MIDAVRTKSKRTDRKNAPDGPLLTMLAAATTTKLHRDRDTIGMKPLKKDAHDGGAVASRTRKDIERQTGIPVISPENFKLLAGKRSKKLKGGED